MMKAKYILTILLALAAIVALHRLAAAKEKVKEQVGSGRVVDAPFESWVFGHVVWFDESTTESVYGLVEDYKKRGMPVDAVIIDSPWETAYNTFEWDQGRYPDAQKLIDDLHAQDIRVIVWTTSMVNVEDPEYNYAREHHFFVRGMERRGWWKGKGGLIDFGNPEAARWWHERMNKVIDMGIDAWKVDGTDPVMLVKGFHARSEYAKKYYSDFYDYTRQRSGRKTLIMARAMEQANERTLDLPDWSNPLGLGIFLQYAPVDKSYLSWVGDQDPTFRGLKIAMRNISRSAEMNYLIVGSDVGGYRSGGPDKEVLIRWAQYGALCPFMENGGVEEHRPWMFDEQTLDIYRSYAILHKALIPYLYSEAIKAWQEHRSMITPHLGRANQYLLGSDIFVAAIDDESGKLRVLLPADHDWLPIAKDAGLLADAEGCVIPGSRPALLRGGCAFTHQYNLHEYPAFFKAGALIPMNAEGLGFFGMAGREGKPLLDGKSKVLLVVPPAPGKTVKVQMTLYKENASAEEISGEIKNTSSGVKENLSYDKSSWQLITLE